MQVWQQGCGVVRRAVWSAVRDYHQPHSWVPFMYVFYRWAEKISALPQKYLRPYVSPDLRALEVPALLRSQDRLTVLDLLYNLGTPHGHQATQLKVKMFESQNISVEESYILKRVLRGFRQLRSLLLWRVCDDAMLQILGVTCHHLTEVTSLFRQNCFFFVGRVGRKISMRSCFYCKSSIKEVMIPG